MNEDYAALLNELEFLCREYMGDDNALEAAACIRTIEIIEAIRNEPVPAAVPKPEPFLHFNLTQALALVESFGGLDGDMAVSWFDKAVDEEGEPMPAGLYAYCYDYPEEGRQWLGDPMAEITAPATAPAAVPDDVARDAAVGAAIERAAGSLPRGYSIEIEIENGAATVRLYDEFCRLGYDGGGDTLAGEINTATDTALAAAQKGE